MEASVSAQQSQTTDSPSSGQRHRRPRRGRGAHGSALDLRPASIAPEAALTSADPLLETSAALPERSGDHSTRSRGQGRGRSRGRGNRSDQNRMVNGRQFGGQLTQQDASTESVLNPQLQGDAAVFQPGQQYSGNATEVRQKPQSSAHKRRASKSQAPDFATRTHEDIDNGYYECPICTNEVRRNSKVWSCNTCWSVFHLSCIKKWAMNQGAVVAQQGQPEDGEVAHPRQWRCPGCNLPKLQIPHTYVCWCEKEIDPRPLPGLPPHSCGNTCGKARARLCPHPCNLTCHAGPCPPCSSMGPTLVCFCGRHEVTKRCSETDYDNGWSCGEICEETMPCGEHHCSRLCHESICGPCEVPITARCYCGQVEKEIVCDEQGEAKESQRAVAPDSKDPNSTLFPPESDSGAERWTGSFDCGKICGRQFDCGEHSCRKHCHSQSVDPAKCPRSPDLVSHCPCGKTPLEQLIDTPRESCMDDIPQCHQRCGKLLPCGHEDESVCHSGECMPCLKIVEIKCRCGRTTSKTMCHQGSEERPQCARTCKTLLNCGRHACLENCCPGERKAAERQSNKRKQRPLDSAPRPLDDGFEAEHICTLQCGRLLRCNTHYCQELCHPRSCGTCREAIFEEVSCHCGRTVLQPPLPCGTGPPPCRYPCNRVKTCNHPQVSHNCHEDDVACPGCPYLVEKQCMCGKKKLKNQKCSLKDVRCGEICGKTLKCGSHSCRKTCHRPGECEDDLRKTNEDGATASHAHGPACQQLCGKPKKICGHPDLENICHAPFACKEDKPCLSKIFITCPCQSQKQEMKCGASKTSEGNGSKTLPCNDECARLERNRKLALALNISQSTHVSGGDHIPYASETLNLFAENVQWGQTQEREFRVFADAADEKRLRFKPMRSQQRAFIHALADDFGLDSESMDPEPHRHVMIWKTPRFVSAPLKTLADALRIRQAQRAANASANVSDTEEQTKKQAIHRPFNGFVISKPRFGLTVDELRAEINRLIRPEMPLTFNIEFLPNEEVLLKAVSRTLTSSDLQQTLQDMKESFVSAIASKGFGAPELCATDASLNVLRRESDGESANSGWSKVVAKKSAPKTTLPGSGSIGSNNTFTALGSNKVTFAKKKPEKVKKKTEPVVDDWETAEYAEEEKERAISGASGDEDHALSSEQSNEVGSPELGGLLDTDPPIGSVESGKAPTSFEGDARPEKSDWADAVETGALQSASTSKE